MSKRKNRNLPFPAQGTRLVETIFDELQFDCISSGIIIFSAAILMRLTNLIFIRSLTIK